MKTEFQLSLLGGANDPPLSSPTFQKELRDFVSALKVEGVSVSPRFYFRDAIDGGASYTGVFIFAAYVTTKRITEIVVAWLNAGSNRKVRLKTDKVEVEAQTVDEIEKLLKLVSADQSQSNGCERGTR